MEAAEAHNARCDCGCVPNVPSMFEMAELRAAARRQKKARLAAGLEEVPAFCAAAPAAPAPREAEARSLSSEADLRRLRELEAEKQALTRDLEAQRQLRTSLLALHVPEASEASRRVSLRLPAGEVEFVVEQDANLAHGGLMWESARVLAQHLAAAAGHDAEGSLGSLLRRLASGGRPPRVLELGCGVAPLPSLVAAAVLGAQATATDAPDVAQLASACVERSAPTLGLRRDAVQFSSYVWSAEEPPPGGPYDAVLGADLLYAGGSQAALASAVGAALRGGGVALFAYETRDGPLEDRFFARLEDQGALPPRRLGLQEQPGRGAVHLVEVSFEGDGGALHAAASQPPAAPLDEGLYL